MILSLFLDSFNSNFELSLPLKYTIYSSTYLNYDIKSMFVVCLY